MNKHNIAYLNAMDITVWETRGNNALAKKTDTLETQPWDCLKKKVAACTACGLQKTRTQTVFGVGNTQADLLIVGEAPGKNEDLQGKPFVGRAGQLLNAMLEAIGLKRENVFIANVLKCRPPNNRNPNLEEINHCVPFLHQQIALLEPKLMVAVGRIAAHSLLNTSESLGRLRGKIYNYGPQNTPLIVTYHPAYLLRTPQDKRKAYQDLVLIKRRLD